MIFINITPFEVIKQFPATRDHYQQATPGIVILFVNLEMGRQFVYTLRQQRDLHLRRARVRPVRFVISNYLLL